MYENYFSPNRENELIDNDDKSNNKWVEILWMIGKIVGIKISLEGLNRYELAEERISQLEDSSIENIHSEKQEEKNNEEK